MKQTKIYSIFGQIEGCVADAMIDESKCLKIATPDIPVTARYDNKGRLAHCALVMTPEN